MNEELFYSAGLKTIGKVTKISDNRELRTEVISNVFFKTRIHREEIQHKEHRDYPKNTKEHRQL